MPGSGVKATEHTLNPTSADWKQPLAMYLTIEPNGSGVIILMTLFWASIR